MSDRINVAGVTFANSDGENRQTILRNLGFGFFNAELRQTVFENERAVEVWINDKQVGFIPRTELSNPMSYSPTLFAQIHYFGEKNIYCVALSEYTPPSEQYRFEIHQACAAYGVPIPAVNDVRAYALHLHSLINNSSTAS